MRLAAVGAALLALSAAVGAFGAHILRDVLGPQQVSWFERAHFYHTWTAAAILGLGSALAIRRVPEAPGWVVVAGSTVFAGTLYALALGGPRWLSAVTPLGGAAVIVGLAWAAAVLWRWPTAEGGPS